MRPWVSAASVLAASVFATFGLASFATLLAGCATVSPEAPPAAATAPAATVVPRDRELWVDASVPEAGDGSRAKPFKTLAQALQATSGTGRIHLRSGLYPGPFTLADGAVLEGQGEVVLYLEGTGTVVTTSGEVRLSGLTVQGGGHGIEVEGTLALTKVQLSGHRRAAVRLVQGTLRAEHSTFQASVSESSGLLLEAGTRAEVRESKFLGPYWRALHARGVQRVIVEDSRFEGPVTGLHQVGGEAVVRRTSLHGGRGPALFVARGSLRAEGVRVKGHEYALQTRQVNPLVVRDFVSVAAERAGLGLFDAKGELEDVVVVGSGTFGALQALDSDVTVRRLRAHRSQGYGVMVRGGK
ncbi:MAG TPA: hypothetical protein VK447_10435, partial [Myxococcaceae bacterium]|nr:hypothetical protein [Myxococcaceae bacterium]